MKNILLGVVIFLSLIIPVPSQIKSKQDCSIDLRMANSTIQLQQAVLEAYKLRIDSLSAHNVILEEKNSQLLGTVNSLDGTINSLNTKVVELSDRNKILANTNMQNHLVIAQQLLINENLTRERDRYLQKIQKANGTTFCEVFHIGCINIKQKDSSKR